MGRSTLKVLRARREAFLGGMKCTLLRRCLVRRWLSFAKESEHLSKDSIDNWRTMTELPMADDSRGKDRRTYMRVHRP